MPPYTRSKIAVLNAMIDGQRNRLRNEAAWREEDPLAGASPEPADPAPPPAATTPPRPEPQLNLPHFGDIWERMQQEKQSLGAINLYRMGQAAQAGVFGPRGIPPQVGVGSLAGVVPGGAPTHGGVLQDAIYRPDRPRAWPAVNAGGFGVRPVAFADEAAPVAGQGSTLSTTPSAPAAAPPAKHWERSQNPLVVAGLYQTAVKRPEEFRQLDLKSYPALSPAELQRFQNLQASVRDPTSYASFRDRDKQAKIILSRAGITRGDPREHAANYADDYVYLLEQLSNGDEPWMAYAGNDDKERQAVRDGLQWSMPVKGKLKSWETPGLRGTLRNYEVPNPKYLHLDAGDADKELAIKQALTIPSDVSEIPNDKLKEVMTQLDPSGFTNWTFQGPDQGKANGIPRMVIHDHKRITRGARMSDGRMKYDDVTESRFFPGPGDHDGVVKGSLTFYWTPDRNTLVQFGIRNGRYFAEPIYQRPGTIPHVSKETYAAWQPSGHD